MLSERKSDEAYNVAAGSPGRVASPNPQGSESAGPIRKGDLMAILAKQGERCALTGRELQPEVANVDHLVPIIRGGLHTADNVQILHRDVNRAKGSMTQTEFVAMCREVVAHADRQGA